MPRYLINFVVVSTLVKNADVNPRVSDSCPIEPTRHVYQTIFCLILIVTYNVQRFILWKPPGLGSVHSYDYRQTLTKLLTDFGQIF